MENQLTEKDIEMIKFWKSPYGWRYGDNLFVVMPLIFHLGLIINPTETSYELRYCYEDMEAIKKAKEALKNTGILQYWKKDHNRSISVTNNKLVNHNASTNHGYVDWIIKVHRDDDYRLEGKTYEHVNFYEQV